MSRLLVALRGRRRQADILPLVGMTQAKISRLERGEGPPLEPAAAKAYAVALGATDKQTARLVELAEIKTAVHAVPRSVVLRNAHVVQGRIRDYVRGSDVVRSWTTDAIPGALQTREWTEAVLAGDGEGDPGEEWWAPRREHLALLNDPRRRWYFLLSEGALRWIVGSRQVQAAQIRHIMELSERDHIHVAVMDLATPKPFPAAYGFHVYGDAAAEVATELGASFVERADDLAYLTGRFELLWSHAVSGPNSADARGLLGRITRTLGR